MSVLQLLIGALTLVTNAFFVGAEFAFVSVRRSQIEPMAEAGNRRARRVLWGLEHVSAMLAAAQLGVTLSTLVLGVVAEPAIAHLLEPVFHAVGVPDGVAHPVAFALALSAATYLHMLLGEMVPKNLALASPERAALVLGPPLVLFSRALNPVILGINAVANGVLRLLHVEPRDEVASTFTDDQLEALVADSREAGLLADTDTERLREALKLGRRPVAEVARAMEDVVPAPPGASAEDLEALSARSGLSRFPVLDPSGRALGYLHVKDALDAEPRGAPLPAAALRPIAQVGEDDSLDAVLGTMRRSGTHLAVVRDAGGRTCGLVTLEDVLRELVAKPLPG